MESITVREVNSEVNVWLNYNHSTKLAALEAAAKALLREVIREKRLQHEKHITDRDTYLEQHNDHELPEPESTDGQ